MDDGPRNQLHEVRIGDEIFADSPARNIGYSRAILGVYPVVGVYPQHAAGPCFYIEDEHGTSAVLWQCCMTLDYIRDLPATVLSRDATIADQRQQIEYLKGQLQTLAIPFGWTKESGVAASSLIGAGITNLRDRLAANESEYNEAYMALHAAKNDAEVLRARITTLEEQRDSWRSDCLSEMEGRKQAIASRNPPPNHLRTADGVDVPIDHARIGIDRTTAYFILVTARAAAESAAKGGGT